ncbi:hypothetical protein ES703_110722 [subsurface metagenome]
MTEEIKLVKVEYYRQVKPPTLDQFLYRKAVRETMRAIKGKVGVTVNPGTGIPIPESALAAKEALKGLTAEKIAKAHPDWVEEYNKKHVKGE